MLAGLVVLVQIAIAPPRGYVSDFAGVLDSGSIRRMDAVISEVRAKTSGEIAVVTLPDIGDRQASDVALQIGRQWGVGAKGEAGDPRKNLGVVMLLVPQKDNRPGTGQIFIATGRGAEGFLTDARAGRIRDAMVPLLAARDYGNALALGVDLIAQTFASEFGITLDSAQYVMPPAVRDERPDVTIPGWVIAAFVLLLILTRGRIFLLPFWFAGRGRGWSGSNWGRRGGWGGWGGGGRGGGGGFGGFGGFGGGGGFSGGGAGGRF